MLPNHQPRQRIWVALLILIIPWTAFAAELEEIVVTADFRERSLANLPFAASVFDDATIETAAVQHFEELIGLVPNMNWSGDGNRARYFQIRGVGELEQYEGAPNPSIGFLIDDIDFSGIGTIATLYDIKQIEVLRGPQGSRYGANALGGLVYVRSADPTDDFAVDCRLTVGSDDTLAGGVALGGPLGGSDAVKYRLSAHGYESNGFRDNPYLSRKDTNGREETSVRGKLVWDASEDWSVRLTAMFSDVDDGYDAFAIDNSLTVLSNNPGRDAQRSIGASLKANWAGSGSFEFTSITSYADSEIDFSFDADWGNDDAWAPITYDYISENDRERTTFSQEFRLNSGDNGRIFNASTEWLVGVYLLQLDDKLATNNQGTYFDPGFNFADSLDSQTASRFEALSLALFGQLGFDVSEAGTLTVGLRVERRSSDYSDSSTLVLDPDETMLGGDISYSHRLGDSMTTWVGLSKGYKAGGFNLGAVPDPSQRLYEQENLWNLEAGIRSHWLHDTLLLDGSIFYSRRIDQQVRTSLQLIPGDPASFIFFTDNAADGKTLGLEVEIRWLPVEPLELYSMLGFLDAEFDQFLTLQTGDSELTNLKGRGQPHAPAYTAAIGGIYQHQSGLFARIDFQAKDEFFFDVSNNQKSQSFRLVNARLGYDTERWTLQLWGRNLFDEEYAVRGFFFGNEPPNFPNALYIRHGDPRQVGVTFDLRY